MKISEIKDKELRELAELRRSERASDWEYTDGLLKVVIFPPKLN